MTMPGCKAYCGLALLDMKPGTDAYAEWMKKPGFGGKTAYCSLLCQDRRETIAAKVAPKVEAGQVWANVERGYRAKVASVNGGKVNYLYVEWGRGDVWRRNQGGHDRLYNFEDGTMTLLSPAPVAKSAEPAKPPVAQASFTGACGISMSSTDGRDISDLIKWHGDGCRECSPVAQGAKCCERCWKVDASVSPSSFDGRSMLWCTMCHVQAMEWSRRQSNDPVDFGVSLLHNPAIPERLTKAQLASDYYDDCLPEAGR